MTHGLSLTATALRRVAKVSFRTALVVAVVLMLGGCGDPISSALGLPSTVDRQPQPGDRRVQIDDLELSEDERTVRLRFTGGPPFDRDDPCSTDYVAVGEVRDGVLEIAVIETVSSGELLPQQPNDDGVLCDAMGHPRTLEIELAEPFLGSTVRDLSGNVRFLSAPEGLVELAGLPDGWTLRSENDVGGSPTGRWQRHYAPSDDEPGEGSRGALDFYQAFGGPVNVSGGDEQRSVQVGAATGTLYRQAPSGELVLVWDLDGTGLALVANEADFPEDVLIDLAASAVPART
jgi:hypothetical protein